MYEDFIEVILRRAGERPGQPALADEEETVDFGTLRTSALRLSASLREAGVRSGDTVVVQGRRTCATVVALLGTMLAGAGYLAVEPTVPPGRLAHMMRRAAPRLVLSDSAEPFRGFGVPVLGFAEVSGSTGESAEAAAPRASHTAPAYLMFTSGTTGVPKDVVVGRRALSWHNRAVRQTFGLTEDDRVLQAASLSFDVSAEEIWPTLAAGASVHFLPQALGETGYAAFTSFLAKRRITVCNLPASYFAGWQGHLDRSGEGTAQLRLVVAGSEVLPLESARRWVAHPSRPRLLNAYGASEATITSLVCEIRPEVLGADRVPIGEPLSEVVARVVDDKDREVPAGEVGELLLSGPGVADGWHRTGDLVRYADGWFWFHGRIDDQVKIQGVRVEPAEIEAGLLAVTGAEDARAVTVNGRLVGCLRSARRIDVARARDRLENLLSAQLMPSEIVVLETFPTTAGGKVDVPALRELLSTPAPSAAPIPDDLDALLCRLWTSLLPADTVSEHSDFFVLGGTSLAAARLVGALRREAGIDCGVRTVFAHSRFGELSAELRRKLQEQSA
ncbi:non-ribosomal peptide synthetase [Streptomyces luteogriseus]|uniref:non-ribosomal peptide synthetase n=1 Tax=Streptomyces luteogriseus TaxID=68233 RepID=UPI00380DD534